MKVRVAFGALLLLSACPLTACTHAQVHARIDVPNTTILADTRSQALFDAAWDWSKLHQLETGGCFTLFDVVGTLIVVTDATESVTWRREDYVQMDCGKGKGIWHTHFKPESDKSVGCNIARGQDIYLIDSASYPLGIVVCGKGRLNLIPYDFSPEADSAHKALLRDFPGMKENEARLQRETDKYSCSDEPRASRERPALKCKEKVQ